MAYYILIFDQALEVMLEKFKMGADSAKNEKRSTMVVETNTKSVSYTHLTLPTIVDV